MIPEYTKESIDNYVNHGLPPGGFVTAVLCNDLFGAMNRADLVNRAHLYDICEYVYNKIPMGCWGSEAKMEAWMLHKHEEREVIHGKKKKRTDEGNDLESAVTSLLT